MPGWALDESLLAATTLDHPWSDPELPSLVAAGDDGRIVGFVASQVRRMRFDGAPIRGVCASDLIVDPAYRAGAPGVLLMTRLLSGPQAVTWSDSATDAVVRVWRTVGGGVDYSRAADFMLVLRPLRWFRSLLGARVRRDGSWHRLTPVKAIPARASPRGMAGDPEVVARDTTPGEIAEHLPEISRRTRVHVDWDAEQLAHALDQVGRLSGRPICSLVTRRGRAIGWYAFLARPRGVSRVLHLAASHGSVDRVFDRLVEQAAEIGSAVLAGRAEPHLEWSLRGRGAALNYVWQPVIRAQDPALAAALASESSLLTPLDGELFAT